MKSQCTKTANRQCSGNTCTCPNGTPTITGGSAGTLCETDSTVDCSSCDVGYTISIYYNGYVEATAGAGLQTCNANTCTATKVEFSNKAATNSITGTCIVDYNIFL